MKILNTTYRDVQDEVLNKTPVSELQPTSEAFKDSLIHIVQHITGTGTNAKYESMRITVGDLQQKMYEAIQNTFKTKYWDTHEFNNTTHMPSAHHDQEEGSNRPANTSFKALVDYLKSKDANKKQGDRTSYTPTEVPANDPDGFINHIYYDFDVIKRYMVLKDGQIQLDITNLRRWLIRLDCYFTQSMKFWTSQQDSNGGITDIEGKSVTNDVDVLANYCQMSIQDGNKISNTWTCPGTGNLVVYGWLDSSSALDNKAIASAYCVLEANINGTEASENWEIISAQPVIPAKSITYVGFNVPVHKGLVVRIRTGFTVGAKSGQFSNEQDGYDTLANNTANGFKCMIYCNKDYNHSLESDLTS